MPSHWNPETTSCKISIAESVEMGISRLEIIFPIAIPVFGIPFVNSKGGRIVPKIAISNPQAKA